MSEYKIEKNVPIAPILKRTIAFPLDEMEIGDSFLMPLIKRNNLTSAISMRRRNKLPGVYKTRRTDQETIRVWRTE